MQIGMEEALSSGDEYISAKEDRNTSKSSSISCYQSASDCSFDWSRDVSPERPCQKLEKTVVTCSEPLEQLDMKPMEDFRDYVNLNPSWNSSRGPVGKDADVTLPPGERSDKLYLNTTNGQQSSICGLSPNSSEDSGFGTGLRIWNPSEVRTAKLEDPIVSRNAFGARYRNSICYARSASCDSLF